MKKKAAEIASRRYTFTGLPLVASESPAITKSRENNQKVLEAVKKVVHLKQDETAVAKEYNLTRYQLDKYVAGIRKIKDKEDAQILQKIKCMRTKANSIFSNEEEMEICQIVRILWKESSIKTTPWILRKIGYIYAERTFNKCVTNWLTRKLAGIGWTKNFVNRNKAYLPRITLNATRREYVHMIAIDEAIETFQTIKGKKIGFLDKFAVSRTKKTIKKMLMSYNDVTSHSEIAIKILRKKLKSDRCDTPETTMVEMRKLQSECKTHARQLMKIANEDIVQICTDSSTQFIETELADDNLVQEESRIKQLSDQLTNNVNKEPSNANDAISDGLNISPYVNNEKSQPTPTNFPIKSNANSVAATNVSSTELSTLDGLLSEYETVLNELDLPNISNDSVEGTALNTLSSKDIESFVNHYEQGELHAPSVVPALTSSELSDSVSKIVKDNDNGDDVIDGDEIVFHSVSTIVVDDSDDDEILFAGEVPMPKICDEAIEMQCQGIYPLPMKFLKKTTVDYEFGSASSVKKEDEDIKTRDIVAGSMKFINKNGLNDKPDVHFPHVDVTITYSNYYLLFHFNKLQSDGQDGTSFDSNYVAHTLRSIFGVSDRVSDILTMDNQIDWKNEKIKFARDLFAVRVNGDQQRLNTFEKYAVNYIKQQKLTE